MEPDHSVDRTPRIITLSPSLALHPVSLSDAEEFFALIERNLEHLGQWLPWAHRHYAFHDALRFLEETTAANAAGTGCTFAIRSEGLICGAIELHGIDTMNQSSSIGYWLDSAAKGKGIMTRACQALVELGFQDYQLHRIEIRCATGNSRSCAIPIRLGFVEEGILRDAQRLGVRWVNLRVFSVLHEAQRKVPG